MFIQANSTTRISAYPFTQLDLLFQYSGIDLTVDLSSLNVRLDSRDIRREWCTQVTSKEEKTETPRDLFAIPIAELRKGPVSLKQSVPTDQLAKRLDYCEYETHPTSAEVDVKLELHDGGVLVSGCIGAEIETQCGTCLADTVIRIAPAVSSYMSPRQEAEANTDEQELTPEDLEKEWFDGDNVILDGLLFDALVLEMPMNPKCGDSCPGLNTPSDFDEPKDKIDPRFASLANFKLEKES